MTDEMTIKTIFETYGISRRAIQGYEEKKLIKATTKTSRGYLIYDEKMVRKMVFIRFCQDLGYSLNEISELLSLDSNKLAAKLSDRITQLENSINSIYILKTKTEKIIHVLNNSDNVDLKIHQIITGGENL